MGRRKEKKKRRRGRADYIWKESGQEKREGYI